MKKNSGLKIVVAAAAVLCAVFPMFTDAENGALGNLGFSLAGEACRVPIYHTDFAFPPEGGQIIKDGDQLYFVRTYLPDCGGAGASGVAVSSRTVTQFPQTSTVVTVPVNRAVPIYTAPSSGCNN